MIKQINFKRVYIAETSPYENNSEFSRQFNSPDYKEEARLENAANEKGERLVAQGKAERYYTRIYNDDDKKQYFSALFTDTKGGRDASPFLQLDKFNMQYAISPAKVAGPATKEHSAVMHGFTNRIFEHISGLWDALHAYGFFKAKNSPYNLDQDLSAEKIEEPDFSSLSKFEVSNPELWSKYLSNNSDDPTGYAYATLSFTARWANAMEKEMAQGKKLEDIAEETSHKADTEGITGFMYGYAVNTLCQVWKHGEELRQWHNSQYGDEGAKANESGGVINPALMHVGG